MFFFSKSHHARPDRKNPLNAQKPWLNMSRAKAVAAPAGPQRRASRRAIGPNGRIALDEGVDVWQAKARSRAVAHAQRAREILRGVQTASEARSSSFTTAFAASDNGTNQTPSNSSKSGLYVMRQAYVNSALDDATTNTDQGPNLQWVRLFINKCGREKVTNSLITFIGSKTTPLSDEAVGRSLINNEDNIVHAQKNHQLDGVELFATAGKQVLDWAKQVKKDFLHYRKRTGALCSANKKCGCATRAPPSQADKYIAVFHPADNKSMRGVKLLSNLSECSGVNWYNIAFAPRLGYQLPEACKRRPRRARQNAAVQSIHIRSFHPVDLSIQMHSRPTTPQKSSQPKEPWHRLLKMRSINITCL